MVLIDFFLPSYLLHFPQIIPQKKNQNARDRTEVSTGSGRMRARIAVDTFRHHNIVAKMRTSMLELHVKESGLH